MSFNGVEAARYPEWTDTLIRAVVPEGASSGLLTVVTTGGGTSNAVHFRITFSTFYSAEGTAREGFETYFTVLNPAAEEAELEIIYLLGSGGERKQGLVVAGSSRATVTVKEFPGESDSLEHDFSAVVSSLNGVGVLVERPMYFYSGGAIDGGDCEMGFTE